MGCKLQESPVRHQERIIYGKDGSAVQNIAEGGAGFPCTGDLQAELDRHLLEILQEDFLLQMGLE